MTVLASFTKDPADVCDYTVRWGTAIGTDTIASSSWSVPAGITKDSDSKSGSDTTIWLSAGIALTSYVCTNTIVTAGGRTFKRSIQIDVASQ